MNEFEMGFRTQIVGGFLRDDVLRYIEQTNRSFTAKVEELERALEQARREAEEQLARADELTARNTELSAKDAELLERLGAMTLTEDSLRAELKEVRTELEEQQGAVQLLASRCNALSTENETFSNELQTLRSKCSEYEASKEHMAEIELRAYRQAKELETQSKEEAARVKKEAAGIVEQLRQQLRRANDSYRLALTHAQEEFGEIQQRALDLLSGFETAAGQLDKLRTKPEDGPERTTITEVFNSIRGKEEK